MTNTWACGAAMHRVDRHERGDLDGDSFLGNENERICLEGATVVKESKVAKMARGSTTMLKDRTQRSTPILYEGRFQSSDQEYYLLAILILAIGIRRLSLSLVRSTLELMDILVHKA